MPSRQGRGGPRGRSFGAAKPLPGQKGYGQTESQKVEAQVAAMEARLAMMKVTLSAEKQKQGGAAQDGSRWRSGAAGAGSLSGYAKDVARRGARRKKRGEGVRGPAGGRSKFVSKNYSNRSRGGGGDSGGGGGGSSGALGRGPKTPRGGRANAEQWDADEVGQWLTSIGLPQYKTVFKENAIDGQVLVEMGTEDLDYLNIKALGHRKMILGGLAEIRVDKTATAPAANTSRQPAPALQEEAAPALKPRKHWAVAAAENQRRIDARGGLPPVQSNGANAGGDGGPLNQGHYDEAAQSALFQQSVMEWRKARAAAKAAEAGGAAPAGTATVVAPSQGTAAGGAGQGPALDGGGSLLQGKYDEEEQSRLFQQSVMQWRRDRQKAAAGEAPSGSEWVNPFGAGAEAAAEIEHPPPDKDGGKLLQGALDESEEHEKFREAVLNWRKGSGKGGGEGAAAGSPSRRSSCWQCFKVLASGRAPLQLDGKNICSQACLDQAQQAQAARAARQAAAQKTKQSKEDEAQAKAAAAAAASSIEAGAETPAAKVIFQNDGAAEAAGGEVRYTGDDLTSLLDTSAWKGVQVDY